MFVMEKNIMAIQEIKIVSSMEKCFIDDKISDKKKRIASL